MNSNPSNEENDTFSEPLTKVELADLGQRPMQNRILHCQSSIAYQIYPFFFLLKQGQIINPPRQKHRLNHQIQTIRHQNQKINLTQKCRFNQIQQ